MHRVVVRGARSVRGLATVARTHARSSPQDGWSLRAVVVAGAAAAGAAGGLYLPGEAQAEKEGGGFMSSFFGSKEEEKPEQTPEQQAAAAIAGHVARAEEMFNSYPEVTRMELYQFLMRRSLEDCDKATESTLLWMRARAAYQLAMEAKKADKTEEYLRRVTEANVDAKIAVDMDSHSGAAYRWYGITLLELGEAEGSKSKVAKLVDVKNAWLKATELDANDATSLNLLGRWCFGLVETDWMTRMACKAFYGSLPSTTYEEAYAYFGRAEKTSPGFYLNNQLMLAKCSIALGRFDEAKDWLHAAAKLAEESEGTATPEDEEDADAAQKLLATCGRWDGTGGHVEHSKEGGEKEEEDCDEKEGESCCCEKD